MPNFQLHWLVAWKALDKVDCPAQLGREAFHTAGKNFGLRIREALDGLTKPEEVPGYFDTILTLRKDWERELNASEEVRNNVTCFAACMLGACGPDFWTLPTAPDMNKANMARISKDLATKWDMPGLIAGNYFDLGHYNRTHQQFRVSIGAIGKQAGIQADMERSYYMGMAMHIAGDLVLHQLVNVSAGSYPLLVEAVWNNEHLRIPKDLWKVHNKVEHFWDSYVRYRFLSDYTLEDVGGKVFHTGAGDITWPDLKEPLGFPVVESLLEKAKTRPEAVKKALFDRLLFWNEFRNNGKVDTGGGGRQVPLSMRKLIELPLHFPAMMADRIGSGNLKTFMWKRVVEGTSGAYPSALLYQKAVVEKTTVQFADPTSPDGYSEKAKIGTFCSARNSEINEYKKTNAVAEGAKGVGKWVGKWVSDAVGDGIKASGRELAVVAGIYDVNPFSLNYVNYAVCPDLFRLRETDKGLTYGLNAFYDLPALPKFGRQAAQVAGSFGKALLQAYMNQQPDGLGILGNFWNLDTGLGFEVRHYPSQLEEEVITRLNFPHVFSKEITGIKPAADPGYRRSDDHTKVVYLGGKNEKTANEKDKPYSGPIHQRTPNPPAFAIREGKTFKDVASITEPDDKKYFDYIRLEPPAKHAKGYPYRSRLKVLSKGTVQYASEQKMVKEWLKAFFGKVPDPATEHHPAPTKSSSGPKTIKTQTLKHRLTLELRIPIANLGGDTAMFLYSGKDLKKRWEAETEETHFWAMPSRLVAFSKEPEKPKAPLHVFTARILVDLEGSKTDVLVREAGKWNNVIPYDTNKDFYGRNFAIATGRKLVLYPEVQGGFSSNFFVPTSDLTYHSDFFPTEHIFLSIWALVRTPSGVYDAFSKDPVDQDKFNKQNIAMISEVEWKKVVLFYELTDKATMLNRCFIDGVLVDVKV